MVIAAAALAGTAVGCGGDAGSGDTSPSASSPTTTRTAPARRPASAADRRAVRATVRLYLSALGALDARRFCSAFTQERRDFIAQSQSADDCVSGQRKAFKAAAGQLGETRARRVYGAYAKSEIFDIEITGRRANAALDVPPAAGPLFNADEVNLTLEGGRWLIAGAIGAD